MRNLHVPVWLATANLPRATTFATLFMLSVLARTTLITVIPLDALALLGNAQRVSVLYFGVSLAGLCGSLAIPWLVQTIRRRWVFTLGAVQTVVAALLLATGTLPGLIAGMVLQVFAIACLEITLNLYVLDHIPRHELGQFEPMRVFYMSVAFTVGPWLGVYLVAHVARWAPFALAAASALVSLGYFWFLRVTEHAAVAPMRRPPPNPMRYLARFFEQPRLRLAWVLAVARSSWWSMFFVYAPIYAVTANLGPVMSGLIVSLGTAALFVVPFWGWVGRRYGIRRLLIAGYVGGGLVTMAVALVADVPWLGAVILLCAAFSTGSIDGAGNLPFLRAVRAYERAEMTTVFATYRDVAQLVPPGVFSLLLKAFDLPAVFLAGGGALVVMARYARHLPRRM
jgi:MFS family permease